MKQYQIEIKDDEGMVVLSGTYTTVRAIEKLREAIDTLRRPAVPYFDASWGSQPPPLLVPSEEELAAFVNRANGAN